MLAIILKSTVLYCTIANEGCLQLLIVSEQQGDLPQQLSKTITIKNSCSD